MVMFLWPVLKVKDASRLVKVDIGFRLKSSAAVQRENKNGRISSRLTSNVRGASGKVWKQVMRRLRRGGRSKTFFAFEAASDLKIGTIPLWKAVLNQSGATSSLIANLLGDPALSCRGASPMVQTARVSPFFMFPPQ